ncbi:MAG: TonB-dependent receptor [Pseudomonadota bacterium]
MKKSPKQSRLCFAACLLSAGFVPSVLAQAVSDADAVMTESGEVLEEIITTGTRRTRMAVSSSPAPIQLINSDMLKESGAPDLMNTIAMQVPSFNASQRGTDAANQTLTASMRSLSPNHALVLVNGKRRHITSNIGASSGSAATDLSFIPTSAIARVEVLTDGAAALYGSDAIAGVVNIVLDEDYSSGGIRTNVSEYSDGGGFTTNVQGKIGFGSDEAYVNLSMETEDRETVSRSVVYGPAVCVANAAECLNRLNNGSPSGYTVSSANRTYIQRDSAMQFHPDYPAINKVGDPPEIKRNVFFFNAGYSLGETTELYSFGSIGQKEAASLQTYRRPSQDGGVDLNGDGRRTGDELSVNKYMYGFNPMQESDESDYSMTVGIDGESKGWNWDVASTYGANEMDYYTTNSMNFSIWNETGASPSEFYDGSFSANQWTTTFDASRDFDIGFNEPMTLASGLEYRLSEYGIDPGDPSSYYGSGAASFPGYNPAVNTGSYDRNSYSAYVNVIMTPTDSWLVDMAVRYENYSDFGNETIGKITTRYDLLDSLAFRGTASTGFRAPTLGEGFYSAVNVGPNSASPQLQPNGPAAATLGFGAGLQPETSENFSVGLVFTPISNLTTTIDAYRITIKDRIQRGSLNFSSPQSLTTATGRTTGSFNNILPDPADTNGDGVPDASFNEALGRALVDFGYIGQWDNPGAPGGSLDPSARATISVSLFNNALDTRSSGVDWVTTYSSGFFGLATMDWTVAANYNKTEVLSAKTAPAELGGAVLYSPSTLSNIETDSPLWRLNLGARASFGNFNLGIRQMFYGPQYGVTSIAGLPASVVNQLDTVKLGTGTFYKSEIDTMTMTNIELNYEAANGLSLGIGADNVFNQYPDKVPGAVWNYNEEIYANTNREYLIGSPVGYFGMRWFAKASYTF